MAQQATNPAAEHAEAHAHPNYVKVWAILLVLLVVSVLGPMIGISWLTLITAFGIALIKAYLVAKHFMHLHLEPRYVVYVLVTCVVLTLLLFAGVAPDVMHHDGQNWANLAAKAEVERALAATTATETPAAAMSPEVAFTTICASCHGPEGNGAGPAAVALNPKPANFTLAEFWQTRDRNHVAKVIREGGASVGKSPLMPAFGSQFDEAAALAIADYVVSKFRPADAVAPEPGQAAAAPAPSEGTATAPAANRVKAPSSAGARPAAPAPAAPASTP
jgi:caa(3)-type oxidase subunit IV